MIIDIHTHAWPDKIAAKARENLETLFKVKLVGEPTVSTLLAYMDRNRIDTSVLCGVATRPDQVPGINDWLLGLRSERLKVFCALHPDYPEWQQELSRIRARGDGIKFQPEFQDFYVDEERLGPLYAEIERLQLPVLFHCGEELSGTMLVRSAPKRILAVKERFPRLILIAAHFGGFNLLAESEQYILGRDIYLDTAFFFNYVAPQEARRLLLRHRPDRLLFGTDFPLIDQQQDLDYLKGLALPDELMERILYRNARELLCASAAHCNNASNDL